MILGVGGVAGSGKDTIGKLLVERHGFHRVGFADALKDMTLRANPVVDLGAGAEFATLAHAVRYCGGWEEAKRYPSVRSFLQRLGVAVRETVGPNVWIDIVERTIFNDLVYMENVVITDVRFKNELDWLRKVGGAAVYVVRPGVGPVNGHVSEQLPSELFDHLIVNDGTVEDLHRQVELLLPKVRAA